MSSMPSRGARVAVVGGGPAGATCAHRLAAAGAEVDLFEARPDSEKPCGGGVPAHALEEFPEILDPGLPRRVVREIVLEAPSGRTARVRLQRGIHVFRRLDLDRFLRRRATGAGARLLPLRVTRARRAAGGAWELDTPVGPLGPYDFLVGADGVQGIVRGALCGSAGGARRWAGAELTLALYAYLPGAAREEMVLKFFSGFDGYLWVFPRLDHVSIGICAGHRSVAPGRLREELHTFIERRYPGSRLDAPGTRGYFIPASPDPPAAAAGEGWALAGDAGGFVDAITREGIAHAMRAGAALAAGLAEGGTLRTPALPPSLAWAHRHRRGFFRPERLERLVRLTAGSSAIRRISADMLEGRQRYGSLKPRLLLAALPCGAEIAWRRLTSPASRAPGAGAAGVT